MPRHMYRLLFSQTICIRCQVVMDSFQDQSKRSDRLLLLEGGERVSRLITAQLHHRDIDQKA